MKNGEAFTKEIMAAIQRRDVEWASALCAPGLNDRGIMDVGPKGPRDARHHMLDFAKFAIEVDRLRLAERIEHLCRERDRFYGMTTDAVCKDIADDIRRGRI